MDTMEITKLVGGACGALLVFLLIGFAAEGIYGTHSENVAYLIETDESAEQGSADAEAEAIDVPALVAEADPASGEKVFRKCAACHKVDGSDGVGPHLNGVVGREKASVAGFGYSAALPALGGAWDETALYAFLENPKGYAAGTSMAFAGLKKSDDRADLIAYLAGTDG